MKKIIVIICLIVVSCDNFIIPLIEDFDITPPQLNSLKVINKNSVQITSNEDIECIIDSFSSRENLSIQNISNGNNSLMINFKEDFIPGKEYVSEFRIRDTNGNSLFFISSYYGF